MSSSQSQKCGAEKEPLPPVAEPAAAQFSILDGWRSWATLAGHVGPFLALATMEGCAGHWMTAAAFGAAMCWAATAFVLGRVSEGWKQLYKIEDEWNDRLFARNQQLFNQLVETSQ